MDMFLAVVVWWLAGVVLLLVLVVFGGNAGRGTLLGRLYHGLSTLPCDVGMRLVRRLCGERGVEAVADVEDYLCMRPNPVLQIMYTLMLGGGYYIYSQNIFPLLPGKFIAEYHVHTGTLMVLVCFTLLCICSTSNPGEVTKENSRQLCLVYQYGGHSTSQSAPSKTCSTCELPRPNRSKHCPTCGICVARFDHHCGWINNCVGSHNLRYFLLFLAANTFLCFYANTVAVLAIWSEMDRHQVFTASMVDYRTGRIIPLGQNKLWLLRWTVFGYMHGIMINFFLFAMGLMLTAFSAYHLWLVAKNSTTYEQIKEARERKLTELTEPPRPQRSAPAESTAEAPTPKSTLSVGRLGWMGRFLSGPNDRGLLANLEECLLPERMYACFVAAEAKQD